MAEFTGNPSNKRKQIPEELGLLTGDDLFHHSFDCAAIGMALVSLDGRFLMVNAMLCNLYGFTEEELVGRHYSEFSYPDDREIDLQLQEQALQGQRHSFQVEKRYVHRDGSVIWGILSVSLVRDEDGKPLYYVSQVQDITERKLNEATIDELHNKNQLILNAVSDGIFGIDEHLGTIFWNDAARRLTGYTYEEMLGKNPYLILTGACEAGELMSPSNGSPLYRTMLEGGCDCNSNEIFFKKNGESFPVEYMTSPMYDNGRKIGVVMTFKDITERQKTEEMLRKSEKLSVVGQIAAGVAHEIRNPLTSLKGFIQFMQSGAANKPEYYEIMMSELSRIELIITEMLVLAKPQMVRYQSKSIESILNGVVTLLETQAHLSNIQIRLVAERDLPLVLCEENQLKQAFINLIKNAMEAMPDGGPIDIFLRAEGARQIRIVLQDRGSGIPEDVLARLGEPFYTTKEKGTGLGMMITYKILEDHHGYLLIESKVGEVTVVTVTLPIHL